MNEPGPVDRTPSKTRAAARWAAVPIPYALVLVLVLSKLGMGELTQTDVTLATALLAFAATALFGAHLDNRWDINANTEYRAKKAETEAATAAARFTDSVTGPIIEPMPHREEPGAVS